MARGAAKRWVKVAGSGRAGDSGTLGERLWKARWCYLFAAPSLILASAFSFYPTIASWLKPTPPISRPCRPLASAMTPPS